MASFGCVDCFESWYTHTDEQTITRPLIKFPEGGLSFPPGRAATRRLVLAAAADAMQQLETATPGFRTSGSQSDL